MKKLTFFFIAIFTFAFFSCKKDLDVPPQMSYSYDGKATHTIAQLLAMRTSAAFDALPEDMVIKGTVISSDKEGNCYKFLAIQDATGGIQIQIDNNALYQKYPVGQTVFVKCKELVLSDYNGLLQLNWLLQGATERLPSTKEVGVIFRDSLVGKEPSPAIIKKSSDATNPALYNTLVKLENCRFQTPGTTYFDAALGYTTTSCNVLLEDGTVVAARISQYATFANNLTPDGNGNIVGILTVFRTTPQLIIRSLSDMQNFQTLAVENTFVTTDMNTNPLNSGWTQANITGSKAWEYVSGSINYLSIVGESGSPNDSWLISPVYSSITNYKNVKLLLNHRVPSGMGNNANMKLYYTTKTLSGSFNAADWTELPMESSQYPSGGGEVTLNIPDQAANSPNFRIALRYNDNRDSRWFVYGVSFKGVSK